MNRWNNKVAIITGASSGIGAAISKTLVQFGLKVIATDRSPERIEKYAEKLVGNKGKLIARKVDMSKEDEIINCFKWVTQNIGPAHIVINNAAILEDVRLSNGDFKAWRNIVETNILGYSIASREAYQIMTANNIHGHIININSLTDHQHTLTLGTPCMYGSSKFAIPSYTDLLRKELVSVGSKIKVTSLSPGSVKTNLVEETSNNVKTAVDTLSSLEPEHIAQAVHFLLSTPPELQVSELAIQATGEA